jgi:hypothetical protein
MITDLDYLKKTIVGLKSYLHSNKLFWPNLGNTPDGKRKHSALTIGGILLAKKKIEAQLTSDRSLHEYFAHREILESIISEWRTAWTRKADLESQSRLRQWGNFIDELVANREKHAPYYIHEVRIRVILNLLSTIVTLQPGSQRELDQSDRKLMEIFKQGDFIWDKGLRDTFQQEDFWFLWGMVDR